MAHTPWHTSFDIEETLKKNITSFSFFQAVRLLKRLHKNSGLKPDSLRIHPDLSLEFSSNDLSQMKSYSEKNGHELITTFLGLYGISSPLPVFYTEDLIAAELDDRTTARTLLDIIQQRLYTLLFSVLKKYRPLYRVVEDQDSSYPDILSSFLGLRTGVIFNRIDEPNRLFRYVGLFSQQPRSALGLKTILEDAFPGVPFDINQCVSRRIDIPKNQRLVLGNKSTNHIGKNAVIGRYVEDSSGKITIEVGPLRRQRFHKLINTKTEWGLLIFLIQCYLTVPIECDIELILAENEAKTINLGNRNWSCIGKNAWLFSGSSCNETRSRIHLHLPNRPF